MLEKTIQFCIKNIISILSFTLISFIGFYKIAPSLFKASLYYLGVDSPELDLAEQVANNEILINDLNQKIENLENEKNKLENELSKSLSCKEGIIEGLRKIKIEHSNWPVIIGCIIVGVVSIGGIVYWIVVSDNITPLKFVFESLKSVNDKSFEVLSKDLSLINTNIRTLMVKIEDIDMKVDNLRNMLDIITPRRNN